VQALVVDFFSRVPYPVVALLETFSRVFPRKPFKTLHYAAVILCRPVMQAAAAHTQHATRPADVPGPFLSYTGYHHALTAGL